MAVVVELPEYRIILIEATLLKKFVNAFQIVERVVDEELQFWYDAQLMAQAASQFVTDGTHIAVEVTYDFVSTLRGNMLMYARAMLRSGLTRTDVTDTSTPAIDLACSRNISLNSF